MDTAVIEQEALRLPEGQRALLVERLLESISHTPLALKEAWLVEAEDRVSAFRSGKIEAIDGLQSMSELRARFSKK